MLAFSSVLYGYVIKRGRLAERPAMEAMCPSLYSSSLWMSSEIENKNAAGENSADRCATNRRARRHPGCPVLLGLALVRKFIIKETK